MEPLQFKTPFPSHQQRGYGLYGLTEILREVIGGYRQVCKNHEWREDYVFKIENFYEEDSRNEMVADADHLALVTTGRHASPPPSERPPKRVVNGKLMRFFIGENKRGSMGSVLVTVDFYNDGKASLTFYGKPTTGSMEHSWRAPVEGIWRYLADNVVRVMKAEAEVLQRRAVDAEGAFWKTFVSTEGQKVG